MAAEKPPTLSLLTAYRARASHLGVLLPWLARVRESEGFTDFELILAEGDTHPAAEESVRPYPWARYLHVPMERVFNKALLINRAAEQARGDYLVVYDVDLLPAEGVLARHLALAQSAPHLLFAGYRVQLVEPPSPETLPAARELLESLDDDDPRHICPEDQGGPTLNYLLSGARFGVCPYFPGALFRSVGGPHEGYAGWGAEDEDLVERVCASGLALVRSYDLLYFHLPHEQAQAGWYEPELIDANRRHLAGRRRARGRGARWCLNTPAARPARRRAPRGSRRAPNPPH
ncbi:MAG: glycosyltransferase [Acidobacteria bacterium]|nr:glycosyltransferase [Acidobacteriota bacterium]MCA1618599.1 glycosyltransferase [Acidobacteriota bacterium]